MKPMNSIEYADLPHIALKTLNRVQKSGIAIEITQHGQPMLRIDPVDEQTMKMFELRKRVSRKFRSQHLRSSR